MAKKKKKTQSQPKAAPQRSDKSWNIALIAIGALLLALLVFVVVRAAKYAPKVTSTTARQEEEASADLTQQSEEVGEPQTSETSTATVSSDFDLTADYYADITIADYGTITVKLDAQAAPISVENFVTLAKSGFYDGLTFHRIMEGFMMQGGDPLGTGNGGSDHTIVGEFSANGIENNLSHTRGAISMARSQDMDSASSQFFIVQQDSTYLDGNYACFGYVTEGMEYVDAICEAAEPTDDNGSIAPEAQPVMESVVIRVE